MRVLTSILSVGLGVCVVWACASSTPDAQTPEEKTSSQEKAAPVAVPEKWEKGMTKDQQIAFMKEKVMPAMAPVFKAHDAKEFEKFGCETCHGPEYKTPTEFLPALTLKDGKLTCFEEEPEISKWMAEQVVPAMAGAMGLPPYNPETHQGFGCGGCHAIEQGG